MKKPYGSSRIWWGKETSIEAQTFDREHARRNLALDWQNVEDVKAETPRSYEPHTEILFQGPTLPIHPILYNNMDESLILKTAMLTKGESGPSGIDADGWRTILV